MPTKIALEWAIHRYVEDQWSLKQIAAEMGCDPSTIWRRFKKADVEIRPLKQAAALGRDRADQARSQKRDALNEQVALLHNEGLEAGEIAGRLNIGEAAVKRLLKRVGVAPRKVDKNLERMIQLYQEGWSAKQIATEMGRDPANVWHRLKRAGVEMRPMKHAANLARERAAATRRARFSAKRAELRERALLLWEKGWTAPEIATELSVHRNTIYRVLKGAKPYRARKKASP